MPVLLYVPKSKNGPFRDTIIKTQRVTRVEMAPVRRNHYGSAFDGRLIILTHGQRRTPTVTADDGTRIDAKTFVRRYRAHFDYLARCGKGGKGITRIDLFSCHTGHSGFAQALLRELLAERLVKGELTIKAPTAQLTIDESRRLWSIGVGSCIRKSKDLRGLFDRGLMAPFNHGQSHWAATIGGKWKAVHPGIDPLRKVNGLADRLAAKSNANPADKAKLAILRKAATHGRFKFCFKTFRGRPSFTLSAGQRRLLRGRGERIRTAGNAWEAPF